MVITLLWISKVYIPKLNLNLYDIVHSEENLDDQNESDLDNNRISKIQQGIDIANEKLKEYNDYN
ncbi:29886_t:CDS:1, partial [Gigaspora margarita]